MVVNLKCLPSIGIVMALSMSAWGSLFVADGQVTSHVPATQASVSDADCVRLVFNSYGPYSLPLERDYCSGVEIHANDSALRWSHWSPDSASTVNESWWDDVASGTLGQVLGAMDDEGFWSMMDRYEDALVDSEYPSMFNLSVCGSDSNRTVTFGDHTMVGLMPETYRLMHNAGNEEVTVDVSVTETSPLVFNVSCIVTNSGDEPLHITGASLDVWPVHVIRDNGCSFLAPSTYPTCVWDIAPGAEATFSPMVVDASDMPDGTYRVFAPLSEVVGICEMIIEGNGYYVNTPPVSGSNLATSESGPSSAVWTFELVGCCDVEDRPEDLMVRWDWESDGEWDTEWSYEMVSAHTFESTGLVNVTYELRDTDGATTTRLDCVSVVFIETDHPYFLLIAIAIVVLVLVALTAVLLMRKRKGSGAAP